VCNQGKAQPTHRQFHKTIKTIKKMHDVYLHGHMINAPKAELQLMYTLHGGDTHIDSTAATAKLSPACCLLASIPSLMTTAGCKPELVLPEASQHPQRTKHLVCC
jgi:hypothetical protein